MQDKDIVDMLRQAQRNAPIGDKDVGSYDVPIRYDVLERAIDEIEHLRHCVNATGYGDHLG